MAFMLFSLQVLMVVVMLVGCTHQTLVVITCHEEVMYVFEVSSLIVWFFDILSDIIVKCARVYNS